jgi:hypothetical protein
MARWIDMTMAAVTTAGFVVGLLGWMAALTP